jgi:sodium/potassium-transporting ATPase subunit alpha
MLCLSLTLAHLSISNVRQFLKGDQSILSGAGLLLATAATFWLLLVLGVLPNISEDQRPLELSRYRPALACVLLILAAVACVTVSVFEGRHWRQVLKPIGNDDSKQEEGESRAITVIREAQRIGVDSSELVTGDLIELRPGDRMTADVRVIRSAGLKVDCSSLTGHSGPQARCVEYSADSAFEAQNLVLAGSVCVEGEAVGVIVGTGARTVGARMQLINSTVGAADGPRWTQTQRLLRLLIQRTLFVCLAIASLFFIPFVLGIGGTWFDAIIFTVGFTLAVLPLSLPVVASAGFQLVARRLAERPVAKGSPSDLPEAVARRPSALQALANCQLAFIDKTGTLTENRLQVSSFWSNGRSQSAESLSSLHEADSPDLAALAVALALCNSYRQTDSYAKAGSAANAVERALFKCAERLLGPVDRLRTHHPRKFHQPFNSSNKLHVTIVQVDKQRLFARLPQIRSLCSEMSGPNLLLLKGAPERILDRCTCWLRNGKEQTLNDAARQELDNVYGDLCLKGLRVLAVADHWLPASHFPYGASFDGPQANPPPLLGLRLLGFVAISDTPRSDAYDCIQILQDAGIRPILVTGDNSSVAKTLARQLGMISINSLTLEEVALRKATALQEVPDEAARLRVVTGSQLEAMQEQQMERLLVGSHELLFARLEPAHKAQLVEIAQRIGLSVIGIGDSLNDLPMLRRCDVSVAVGGGSGEQGYESNDHSHGPIDKALANQCSLLFPHGPGAIGVALEEARACSLGLRKAATFLLCAGTPQVAAFVATILFGLPMPLSLGTPILIDLALNAFPALCLLLEPSEQEDKPQSKSEIKSDTQKSLESDPQVIDWRVMAFSWLQIGMVQSASAFFAYFVIMAQNGFWLSDLIYIRHRWDSQAVTDLRDSVGQEWDFEQRQRLQSMCQSGFLFAILLCQIATALVCRTRYTSSFHLRTK